MTEKERLLGTLFSEKEGRSVTNVKFFLGDDRNVSEEELCREANIALEQERMGLAVPKPSLDAGLPRATVAKFLA